MSYEEGQEFIQSIEHTINYADLFELLKQEFNTPVDLLETLVIQIAACIKKEYPIVKKIRMTVDKLHPPISGFKGTVGVTYEKEY
ncbi:MAG: dihydroneopterin aldolase [Chitinophagaceae bacterium]|nr:dihydroneopterin aldolase [Chitinophagaceae bacterium]